MNTPAKRSQKQRLIEYEHDMKLIMLALGLDRTTAKAIIKNYEKYIVNWLGTREIPIITAAMAARLLIRAVYPNDDIDGL
ncbi:hypothetical protein PO250_01795 [Limosilactobacillus mucosae]|uniref:Uncharacterized protein n=1 Tax=Limosilactobacillus mucosae TaxID=97478 RepID=A0AAJ1HS98_LIMMU|nr:hypothetical protein [Limosilactobacillus mucosae]MDC2829068.1 hypothetical protein [Limosilactobacillus mucosae]